MADSPMLAVFLDRDAMRHERWYPHPAERVWEAVTTGEHLNVWLLPVAKVEQRPGGRCSFSWGGPEEHSIVGEVTVFDPPRSVQYTFGTEREYLRFDLEPDGDGTRLYFTQSFEPGGGPEGPEDGYPGADKPAGPDTPWRPGFVAGFHEMLDDLTAYLAGEFTADDRAEHLGGGDLATNQRHARWIETYRTHIRENCPRE